MKDQETSSISNTSQVDAAAQRKYVNDTSTGRFYEKILNRNDKQELIDGYNEWSKTYEDTVEENQGDIAMKVCAEIIAEYNLDNEKKLRLLDVACGTGLPGKFVRKIKKNDNIELYGFDISDKMLNIAKSKEIYKQLDVLDIESKNLPYEKESFDIVLICAFFIDGHAHPSVLNNIVPLLKKDGFLLLTVREKTWSAKSDEYLKWFDSCSLTVEHQRLDQYISKLNVLGQYILLRVKDEKN